MVTTKKSQKYRLMKFRISLVGIFVGFILIVETWSARQFVPLNPVSVIMPSPGMVTNTTLMLANYPSCGPLFLF